MEFHIMAYIHFYNSIIFVQRSIFYNGCGLNGSSDCGITVYSLILIRYRARIVYIFFLITIVNANIQYSLQCNTILQPFCYLYFPKQQFQQELICVPSDEQFQNFKRNTKQFKVKLCCNRQLEHNFSF